MPARLVAEPLADLILLAWGRLYSALDQAWQGRAPPSPAAAACPAPPPASSPEDLGAALGAREDGAMFTALTHYYAAGGTAPVEVGMVAQIAIRYGALVVLPKEPAVDDVILVLFPQDARHARMTRILEASDYQIVQCQERSGRIRPDAWAWFAEPPG